MLLPWRSHHQGWRWRTHFSELVPSCVFLLAFLMAREVNAMGNAYPPPHMSPSLEHQLQSNAAAAAQHHHQQSSAPSNQYYQMENQNKLVPRQIQQQQQSGGLTAAATNYLLQQLQVERQQQQIQFQQQHQHPNGRAAPVAQMANLPPQNSPQAQTLQLLAGLTPQQISALQSVMPRSNQQIQAPHPQQPQVASAGSSTAPVAVLPPEDMQIQFAHRSGPFDTLLNKAKAWLPDMMGSGSNGKGSTIGEPKMRDLHRLPKPPKYPLYDLPSIGLATPPPAPIMHPMASLPNNAFDWDGPPQPPSPTNSSPRSTFNQQNWMSPSPTSSTSRRSRPSQGPPKPSKSSFLRSPFGRPHKKSRPTSEPPVNYNRRNHGPPPPPKRQPPRNRNRNPPPKPPKKGGPSRGRYPPPPRGNRPPSAGPTGDPYTSHGSGGQMGFDHPMASNLSPAQSPALGRPLGYEEYMARPSHSYTDDPWNFDPFASQMNQGLHTHALRYNYDPLGMNALDTEANSHLDPNKLSYPGDSFNQDMVKDSPGVGSTSQIGGWDKPYKKRPYSGDQSQDPFTELTPPGSASNSPYSGSSSFSSSPSDPYPQPPSGNRYKNRERERDRESESGSGGGTGYLGDALNGGRRGDYSMDHHDSESSLPSYGGGSGSNRGRDHREKQGYEPSNDDAPTIDLESLTPPAEDDGMSGLEFTIETSMDKGAQEQHHAESPQPDPHPLGPMQPAANPYLSDQYNPYMEQSSSPSQSSVPGTPYGPDGFRERYGRRRTRNNNENGSSSNFRSRSGGSSSSSSGSRYRTRARAHYRHHNQQQSSLAPTSSVPEGVQIFNDIIRPQLQQSSSSSGISRSGRQRVSIHPNHAALRRSLYNAINQQSPQK